MYKRQGGVFRRESYSFGPKFDRDLLWSGENAEEILRIPSSFALTEAVERTGEMGFVGCAGGKAVSGKVV